MVKIWVERTVLSVIIAILLIAFGVIACKVKQEYVAYNPEVTAEEFIKSEYKYIEKENKEYAYMETGSFMFYIAERGPTELKWYETPEISGMAYRMNEMSGYASSFPGITVGVDKSSRGKFISTPNNDNVLLNMFEYQNEYVIEILDYKENNVKYYIEGELLDSITLSNSQSIIWAKSLTEFKSNVEIYGIQDGKKFHVIDLDGIKEAFNRMF